MRKWIVVLVVAVVGALSFTVAAGTATADEHPGCRGIEQAKTKANPKGVRALDVVSEKFGCGSAPVDALACPTGESLARYTYNGSQTGPVDAYGYPTWSGSWTTVSGGTAAWIDNLTNEHTNGGGFYWGEQAPGTVQTIVLKSSTGEIVTLSAPVPDPVSQNHFVDRTGIAEVNICGGVPA